MGRLIDANKTLELYNENAQITIDKAPMPKFLWESIVRQVTVEAIPKEQYEARLKADLVAMLTEIQMEIDEIPINPANSEPFRLGQASAYDKCENLIQQKIDSLKKE